MDGALVQRALPENDISETLEVSDVYATAPAYHLEASIIVSVAGVIRKSIVRKFCGTLHWGSKSSSYR